MQKVSYIINAVLLVLIGILFYLFFTNKSTTAEVKSPEGAKIDKSVKIAYVDIDSLQEKYKYFIAKRDELKKEASNLQSNLEARKNDFQKMYENAERNAPTMTQNQLEAEQMKLQNKQMELQNYESSMSDQLDKKSMDFQEAFLKKIEDYINKLNKDKKYAFVLTYSRNSASLLYTDKDYDITKTVVEGLNKEYEESIKK